MKKYELTALISPDLSEEEVISIQNKIDSVLSSNGKILNTTFPEKKDLGTEINKKTKGILLSFSFEADSDKIKIINIKVKKEKNILRFIIISKPIKKDLPIKRRPTLKNSFLPEENLPEEKLINNEKIKVIKSPKADISDIDKKIEEILND